MTDKKRILILAGHRKSFVSTLIICCLTKRVDSVEIVGVICPSEFNFKRIRAWYNRFGLAMFARVFAEIGLTRNRKSKINEEYELFYDLFSKLGMKRKSLSKLCSMLNIPLHIVKNINAPEAVGLVADLNPDYTIYSGAGILKRPIIHAANKVLNIHCGPLPLIRGMNAVEWTLFLGLTPEVTLHYIDEGIDTGKIIATRKYRVVDYESLEKIRSRSIVTGINLLIDVLNNFQSYDAKENPINKGKQYFSMCEVLKDQLRKWINQGITKRFC
jgi:hypothetical protein